MVGISYGHNMQSLLAGRRFSRDFTSRTIIESAGGNHRERFSRRRGTARVSGGGKTGSCHTAAAAVLRSRSTHTTLFAIPGKHIVMALCRPFAVPLARTQCGPSWRNRSILSCGKQGVPGVKITRAIIDQDFGKALKRLILLKIIIGMVVTMGS